MISTKIGFPLSTKIRVFGKHLGTQGLSVSAQSKSQSPVTMLYSAFLTLDHYDSDDDGTMNIGGYDDIITDAVAGCGSRLTTTSTWSTRD